MGPGPLIALIVTTPALTSALARSTAPTGPRSATAAGPAELEKTAELKRLAREFVLNDGFHQPAKPEMLADDFVWFGPIVGPLNKQDFLGTVASLPSGMVSLT